MCNIVGVTGYRKGVEEARMTGLERDGNIWLSANAIIDEVISN